MTQQVIAFEGADMSGKTQIAKELSRQLGIPYFKASSEHESYLQRQDKFLMQLRYADPRVADLLKQTGQSIIFDRAYPSEFVYTRVLGRQADELALRVSDDLYSSLGMRIIICRRSSYAGIVDDIDDHLSDKQLDKISAMYDQFISWTKCKCYVLNVDDENLEREVAEVRRWLST